MHALINQTGPGSFFETAYGAVGHYINVPLGYKRGRKLAGDHVLRYSLVAWLAGLDDLYSADMAPALLNL